MLNQLKDIAARQVGKVLASDATLKVLSNPQVNAAMVKALNLQAEARGVVRDRVKEVASALDLVTREDVATLRRSIRDLTTEVDDLRAALDEAQEAAAAARDEAEKARAQMAEVAHADGPVETTTAAPASKPAARKARPKAKAAQQ